MSLIVPLKWQVVAERHHGIIAGGALRDLILDRPVKDVDIFVEGLIDDGSPEYMEGFRVTALEEKGVHYDIIKHRHGSGFLETFDLGICKVAYEPSYLLGGSWTFHPDFVQDLAARTITVLRPDNYRHEEHLARVKKKYPKFKVVQDDWNTEIPF